MELGYYKPVIEDKQQPHAQDEIYIFTSLRPESFVIPAAARGGVDLIGELVGRKLFDGDLAIKAASVTEGLFCWPPLEAGEQTQ